MLCTGKPRISWVFSFTCICSNRFILVDVGDAGRQSDAGVLSNSGFGQALEYDLVSIPNPAPLTGTSTPDYPYVLVGDEGFPLKKYLLRPYAGKYLPGKYHFLCSVVYYNIALEIYTADQAVFNYRLSRARRIIENSFGILAARWRIFRRPIIAAPERVELFAKAAIALHNYLITIV